MATVGTYSKKLSVGHQVVAVLAVLVVSAPLTWMTTSRTAIAAETPYRCGVNPCKYGKAKVVYSHTTAVNRKLAKSIWVRGGTADDQCVGSDSGIDKWRMKQEFVSNEATGAVFWSTGPSVHKTNCSPSADAGLIRRFPDQRVNNPYAAVRLQHIDKQNSRFNLTTFITFFYSKGHFS